MEVIATVTTGAIKGAEVGFSNSALQLGVSPAVDFEREEESAEFKNTYTLRSPPPLIVTDNCCLPPLARVTRARASLSFKFMCLRSVGVLRLPQLRLKLVNSE